MVKPPLGLFEVQVERTCPDAPELHQPGLGHTPEVLDAVDVRPAVGEDIVRMRDAVMLLVADVDPPVIRLPFVGI